MPYLVQYPAEDFKDYVPIDYIKAEITGLDIREIIFNPLLDFSQPVNTDTGVILKQKSRKGNNKRESRSADYKNLYFKYYPHNGNLYVSGSLHTFSNDGRHNYNDYTFDAFKGTLKALYDLFGISAHNLCISQLEFGVNIIPPFSANSIIDCCLYHKWTRFENKYDSFEGKHKQARHDEYIIKIYNKGLHNKLGYDILRIERKQIDWNTYCKKMGIGRTLHDLIQSNFIGLRKTLIENWNEVLFFDPLMDENQNKVFKYRDPIYWSKLQEKSRTTRSKHFNKLKEYNREFGQNIQGKVSDLIEHKLNELSSDVFTFSYFTYIGNTLSKYNSAPTHLH